MKYTRAQRLRAVRLYEQCDCSAVSVINELGVSVEGGMLAQWRKAWLDGCRDGERALGDRCGERYTTEQKRVSVNYFLEHEDESSFSAGMRYLKNHDLSLAGFAHDSTDPTMGRQYVFFPIRRLPVQTGARDHRVRGLR